MREGQGAGVGLFVVQRDELMGRILGGAIDPGEDFAARCGAEFVTGQRCAEAGSEALEINGRGDGETAKQHAANGAQDLGQAIADRGVQIVDRLPRCPLHQHGERLGACIRGRR